jgi:hypothetical protein
MLGVVVGRRENGSRSGDAIGVATGAMTVSVVESMMEVVMLSFNIDALKTS